jgi:hypothetical protein
MTQQTIWNVEGRIVVDTRISAAAAIEPVKPSLLHRVFDFIQQRGERGATDEKVAYALHMKESTARAAALSSRPPPGPRLNPPPTIMFRLAAHCLDHHW